MHMTTAAAAEGRSIVAHKGNPVTPTSCARLFTVFDGGPRWYTIVSPIFTADMLPPSVPLAAAARNLCLASVGETENKSEGKKRTSNAMKFGPKGLVADLVTETGKILLAVALNSNILALEEKQAAEDFLSSQSLFHSSPIIIPMKSQSPARQSLPQF
jgi:hypothetical protein